MNKKIFLITILVTVGLSQAYSQQKAELISFSQLEKIVNTTNDTTYIVNFWATWCGPCLVELPAIQEFYQENQGSKVKLLMVSFDFPDEIKKVNKFILKKNLKPQVYLISDTDQNAFIERVSKNWHGTIPATWFINNKSQKRLFIEKPLSKAQLSNYLREIE